MLSEPTLLFYVVETLKAKTWHDLYIWRNPSNYLRISLVRTHYFMELTSAVMLPWSYNLDIFMSWVNRYLSYISSKSTLLYRPYYFHKTTSFQLPSWCFLDRYSCTLLTFSINRYLFLHIIVICTFYPNSYLHRTGSFRLPSWCFLGR